MFSVKHNQSPRSQPLYKPWGPPPINTGWLGDLSSRDDHGAALSWAEPSRARRQTAGWILMQTWGEARWWPACQAVTDLLWVNTGKDGGKKNLVERPWCFTSYLHHLSWNPRECVNVAKVIKFMVVLKWFFSPLLRVRKQEVILEKVSLLLKNVKQRTRYTQRISGMVPWKLLEQSRVIIISRNFNFIFLS